MKEKLAVLFFLRRVGPYHHSRFEEASKKMNLISVETRPTSTEYPWEFAKLGSYQSEKFPIADEPEKGIRGIKLMESIHHLFDTYRPDVVVTTGWADPEYHAVVLEAAKRRIPRVVISDSRYEDEPRKFYKEFVKRLILKSYSSALVAGTASKKYIVQLGFSSSAVFQPWDVVDNFYFSSRQRNEAISFTDRYFLCVSRFIQKKNLHRLVEAFAAYRSQGGKRELVLLGSGELEDSIKQLISKLNMNKFIRMEGFIQYEALPNYFSRSFCLILPSTTDQWGLVVNEAMAAGVPVLVSNQCGCAFDLVQEGSNGYIFNPFSIRTIAEAMVSMDEKVEDAWGAMGQVSRTRIQQWDLTDFSTGLERACRHALMIPVPNGLNILQRILSY